MKFEIESLYEDNHCLVVNKPARLLTTYDDTDDITLEDIAKKYIAEKYNKPGKVYLSLIHRIDRPVSGCVLFARTSKAAERLSEQFRARKVDKKYWAVVENAKHLKLNEKIDLEDWLKKDRKKNTSAVVKEGTEDSKFAKLSFHAIKKIGDLTLIEIQLETGRSHQIRVQLSHASFPIVGDQKYGATHQLVKGVIALHCREMTFEHPTSKKFIPVVAPLSEDWKKFGDLSLASHGS